MKIFTRSALSLFILMILVAASLTPYGIDRGAVLSESAAAAPAALQSSHPSAVGWWEPVAEWASYPVPIHSSLLPDGRLLFWGRDKDSLGRDVWGNSQAYTWNPANNTFAAVPNTRTNLFCSGHSFLPDGRLLVTGGHNVPVDNFGVRRYEYEGTGEKATNIFDYRINGWKSGPDMTNGRWYPYNVTLANGQTVIVSGQYLQFFNSVTNTPVYAFNKRAEIYDPVTGTLRQSGNDVALAQNYPFLHLAPSGNVFLASAGADTFSRILNPKTDTWSFGPDLLNEIHDVGTSVTYGAGGKVMVVGGRAAGGMATNVAEVINLSATSPEWTNTGSMNNERMHFTSVLLPDGKVFVAGGTKCPGTNNLISKDANGNIICSDGAVKTPEIWNPQTGQWSLMAPHQKVRVYHSTALLLPDGRVMVGGGGLPSAAGEIPGQFAPDPTFGHRNVEFFWPPYLYNATGLAPRPVITDGPTAVIRGKNFIVNTPDAANIASVVLVRLPSVTHGFNQDQRRVVLSFTPIDSDSINVSAPSSATECPVGHYMMFIINNNGTPSVAKIVNIFPSLPDLPQVGGRVVQNMDGRLDAFYRGTDDNIYHTKQTVPGRDWSGHEFVGEAAASNPVAIADSEGRLHLFAAGKDGSLYHRNQLSPGSARWSKWDSLGGTLKITANATPAVVRASSGLLSVFYWGADNGVYVTSQLSNGTWSSHQSLAGIITAPPAVAINSDGRIEVVVRGTDNAFYHNTQSAPGSSIWSGWFGLGGIFNSGPAIARNTDGKLHVFGAGTDNGLFYSAQTSSGSPFWSGWSGLAGALASTPVVEANADGRLEVIVKWADNSLYHISQTVPGASSWSSWGSLGGILTSPPVATRNTFGQLEIFVRATDNTLFHNTQTTPGGPLWSGWFGLGGSLSGL